MHKISSSRARMLGSRRTDVYRLAVYICRYANTGPMTKQIILLSLVVATILVTSILSISISQANAFDPGGPPVGGAVPTVPTGNWEMINYGPTGGGYSPQNQINKDNVQYLETKWVFPYTQTPIPSTLAPAQIGSGAPVVIVDGVGYVLMNDRRILSIDLTTGKLIWNNTYGTAFDAKKETEKYPWLQQARAHGHAINYYREKGWLITSSIGSCNLYAVDAKTGKTAWTLTTEQVCGTNEEFGDPTKGIIGTLGNQGYMSSLGTLLAATAGILNILDSLRASTTQLETESQHTWRRSVLLFLMM